jgi:hypothetical protein
MNIIFNMKFVKSRCKIIQHSYLRVFAWWAFLRVFKGRFPLLQDFPTVGATGCVSRFVDTPA